MLLRSAEVKPLVLKICSTFVGLFFFLSLNPCVLEGWSFGTVPKSMYLPSSQMCYRFLLSSEPAVE